MKTIRLLRSTGLNLPRFTEGQVADVPDETAELLCGLSLAEVLKTVPDEPLRAIPDNPSIVAAEAKLAQIKEGWLGGGTPLEAPKHRRRPGRKSDDTE